jgi:Ni/Fe-hydrogenase 1 B-type cytochrome subunit
MTASTSAAGAPQVQFVQHLVWQWPIRVFHWAFALSVLVLFVTGLNINWPWFGGGDGAGVMNWMRWLHFTAATVFCVAYVWRFVWFVLGDKYARSGFPYVWRARWWRELFGQMLAYARYDFRVVHVGHNALAGLSYVVFAVGVGAAQILTGLAMFGESNPGGRCDRWFGWVLPLCGGSFATHMWHHLFAWGFLVFVVLHLYIVLLDARQYRNGLIRAMFTGRKRVARRADGTIEHDEE